MRPYNFHYRLPLGGVFLLVSGSVIIGIGIGVLAYWISTILYLIVVFPLFVGLAGIVVIAKLGPRTKVHHPLFTTFIGLLTGVCITGGFYGTPYFVTRHDLVTDAQRKYDLDTQTASAAFDAWLVEETGSKGFWGYMKLRAIEGEDYTNSFGFQAMPVSTISFTLKSTWAWIYWIFETLLFCLPVTWMGFEAGKNAFSESANDWYDGQGKQLGAIPFTCKDELLALCQKGDLTGVCDLLVKEGDIPHPVLEIYEHHTEKEHCDILMTIKQTSRVSPKRVKRTTIGRWEVEHRKFTHFSSEVSRKFSTESFPDE